MTGSHTKKFLFFHVYKVAGCSLLRPLSAISEFRSEDPHLTPAQLRQDPEGKKRFEEYFTFAFVRNPWDWHVSLYEYMRTDSGHFQHGLAMSQTFEEYIKWRMNEKLKGGDFESQYQILSDDGTINSPISLDFVGRYERLNEDFNQLRLTLGISGELPHVNKSKRKKNYRDYYTSSSRDKIAEAHEIDIKTFGYEF